MVMTECSSVVSVSQTDQLRGVLNNPQKISEYVSSNPEHAYFELFILYKEFMVRSYKLGNLTLAHSGISGYIKLEHPSEDGDNAIREMDKWRDTAMNTSRLLGMS